MDIPLLPYSCSHLMTAGSQSTNDNKWNTWSKFCYDRLSVGQFSWCQRPTGGSKSDFYYCQTAAGLLTWGVLSDERMDLSFPAAAGARQRSHVYCLWNLAASLLLAAKTAWYPRYTALVLTAFPAVPLFWCAAWSSQHIATARLFDDVGACSICHYWATVMNTVVILPGHGLFDVGACSICHCWATVMTTLFKKKPCHGLFDDVGVCSICHSWATAMTTLVTLSGHATLHVYLVFCIAVEKQLQCFCYVTHNSGMDGCTKPALEEIIHIQCRKH
jgi:hypothetical protein